MDMNISVFMENLKDTEIKVFTNAKEGKYTFAVLNIYLKNTQINLFFENIEQLKKFLEEQLSIINNNVMQVIQ